MKKARRRKVKRATSNPHGSKRRRRMTNRRRSARRNPGMRRLHRHGRRRNPGGIGGFSRSVTGIAKAGLFGLIGLVLARQVPQMVLGPRNAGMIGYFANFVTALVSGWGIGKVAGPDAGTAAGIGGGIFVANRIIQDKFTPVGAILSLQGVGDPLAAGLGEIVTDGRAYFPVPVAWDGNNPVIPKEIRPMPALMLPPGGGMGYSSRFVSRFGRAA